MVARHKISAATLTFLGFGMSKALEGLLSNKTGSGKSNMAASKPDILIYQLPDEIEAKFRRLDIHFRGQAFQRN